MFPCTLPTGLAPGRRRLCCRGPPPGEVRFRFAEAGLVRWPFGGAFALAWTLATGLEAVLLRFDVFRLEERGGFVLATDVALACAFMFVLLGGGGGGMV